MALYDGHAHIGSEEERMLRRKQHIVTMVCAGTLKESSILSELSKTEDWIIPAYGLHPWYAEKSDVEQMRGYLEHAGVIGEIGMDSVWCQVPLKRQQQVFEQQLFLASQWKKPVVLHTKGQEREIARLIRQFPNRYLVHWYSELRWLDDYLEQGCYFTVGPDFSANPAVQQVLKEVPKDRLLVETDGWDAVNWALGEVELSKLPEILQAGLKEMAAAKGISEPEAELLAEKNLKTFLL